MYLEKQEEGMKQSQLIRTVEKGVLTLSFHAKQRMAERGYSFRDVVHILLHGRIVSKEYKESVKDWAYRIQGNDFENDEGTVVVANISRMSAVVVTVLA